MKNDPARIVIRFFLAMVLSGCVTGHPPAPEDTTIHETTALRRLSVTARNIVTADDGAAVRLRGVSLAGGVWQHGGAAYTAVEYCTTESDIARLADWGANAITFYMDWTWFQSPGGWTFVNRVLNWCRKYNVYIVPSLTFYPEGGLRGGHRFWTSIPAQIKLRDFWVRFARTFRGREEIAGYDLLNEPQADGLSIDTLRTYVTSLVDAVRQEDPDTSIYIEPMWGSVFNAFTVDRPNLVYNFHYYEPFYYTSQGFPWISEGSAPLDLSYPGRYLTTFTPVTARYLPHAPAGTYDWTLVTESITLPAGVEYLFFKVFSDADPGATLYFDNVEYSRGAGFLPFANGSFEEQSDGSTNPRYFYSWKAAAGTASRTTETAADGNWSVKLSGCTGWGHWANYDENFWIGDAAAVRVTPGETITVRYRVRARNAAADKNGILLWYASASAFNADRTWLEHDLDDHVVSFSATNNVPVFIGEFTASLAGKRPDIINYIGDAIDCFDERGLSWTYYVYRENWTGTRRYLGIYNGPPGATVESGGCDEQSDVVALVRSKF